MDVRLLAPTAFCSNCYLLLSKTEKATHALVVDPSVSSSCILEALQKEHAVCDGILLTHGHFDHVLSLDALRDMLPDVPTYIHEADAELLSDGKKNAFATFFGQARVWRPADCLLKDGDVLALGNEQIRVLHTPGHTPGSVCYLCDGKLISGDTLFSGNVGRCDLYGGDIQQMMHSLQRLQKLPPDTRLFPGHGDGDTLGHAMSQLDFRY